MLYSNVIIEKRNLKNNYFFLFSLKFLAKFFFQLPLPEIFQEAANKEIHLDECFLHVHKIRRFDPSPVSWGLTASINRVQETSGF
jgi:hypothetical protein